MIFTIHTDNFPTGFALFEWTIYYMQPVVQLATHMLHGNDNYVLEKLTLCRQTWHHTSVEGNMKYDKTLMLAIAC